MQYEDVKEILMQESEEFRHLSSEHKKYDQELKQLMGKKYPAPEDQVHEVELKKKKLAIKDRMLEMVSDFEKTHQAQE